MIARILCRLGLHNWKEIFTWKRSINIQWGYDKVRCPVTFQGNVFLIPVQIARGCRRCGKRVSL